MDIIWKRFKDTTLCVSNTGLVRHHLKDTLRVLTLNQGGYLCVSTTENSIVHTFRVHRMVAETFIPLIEGKDYVNHKNGIKTDNNVANLEWVTSSENTLHALDSGLKGKGSSLEWSVLSEKDVIFIKEELNKGVLAARLAEMFNISPGTLSNLRTGRAWKGIGPDVIQLDRKDSKRKLTAEDIPVIRQMIADGDSDTEIGLTYSVARGTIYRIRTGQNWSNY
jgi:hypothetical protein